MVVLYFMNYYIVVGFMKLAICYTTAMLLYALIVSVLKKTTDNEIFIEFFLRF